MIRMRRLPLSVEPRAWPLFALIFAIALIVQVACAGYVHSEERDSVTVVTADARHVFTIELANTPATRAQGLMYRRSMPQDHGMLFDFGRVEMVTMWMRNTYIPLDMLFIRPDGTIARIARNTEPLSERQISSGEPVLGVLEINAGLSSQLGIDVGDRVEHPIFAQ
jgi:uncharacterized membrane protein (UPF0127 family)